MTPAVSPPPGFVAMATFHRLSVETYEKMVATGLLDSDDRVELLEGYMVQKMPSNPPHEFATTALYRRLDRLAPAGWVARCQHGVRLADSKPEPDVALVRGSERDFAARSPTPADAGLVAEVSDTSLVRDQQDKARIYARDRIPVYWVVNLPDRRVEVYTDPTGPGDAPRYHTLRVFPAGAAVPVELDGAAVGAVPVDDLLP